MYDRSAETVARTFYHFYHFNSTSKNSSSSSNNKNNNSRAKKNTGKKILKEEVKARDAISLYWKFERDIKVRNAKDSLTMWNANRKAKPWILTLSGRTYTNNLTRTTCRLCGKEVEKAIYIIRSSAMLPQKEYSCHHDEATS